MDNQTILAVDNSGKFLRYIPKEEGHAGDGIHHLAITVFVFNAKGQVLLQKRKHQIFDNLWDNTASTHQLHLKSGRDETDEQATKRALKREYGIEKIKLEAIGEFNYSERFKDYSENELCRLLIGNYEGELKLNPQVAYGCAWMDKKVFIEDIEKNPKLYTPWCKIAAQILKEKEIL